MSEQTTAANGVRDAVVVVTPFSVELAPSGGDFHETMPVAVRALLGHSTVTLSEDMNLKAGDVFTTDFAGTLTLIAEHIPMLRGKFGMSRGQQAVKIDHLIRRHRPAGVDVLAARRPAAIPEATTNSTGAP